MLESVELQNNSGDCGFSKTSKLSIRSDVHASIEDRQRIMYFPFFKFGMR